MSRSGDTIYESDAASDFLSTITVLLEREVAFLSSPEQILNHGWWLAQMLTVLELMLLFEQQDIGSSVFMHTQPQTVQRWRETFLSVWDSEWKADNAYPYIYEEPAYRKANRSVVISLFDRMKMIAHYWHSEGYLDKLRELVWMPLDKPLPHFSINCQAHQQNRAEVGVERFTTNLIRHVEKEIIFWLSPEKRAEVVMFDAEDVWVSVDVLRFLCEAYEQTPGVNEHIVRIWRETTVHIGQQSRAEGGEVGWDDSLRHNVEQAFDGLEAVARKYPPIVW
jgi:hypothetical protein